MWRLGRTIVTTKRKLPFRSEQKAVPAADIKTPAFLSRICLLPPYLPLDIPPSIKSYQPPPSLPQCLPALSGGAIVCVLCLILPLLSCCSLPPGRSYPSGAVTDKQAAWLCEWREQSSVHSQLAGACSCLRCLVSHVQQQVLCVSLLLCTGLDLVGYSLRFGLTLQRQFSSVG